MFTRPDGRSPDALRPITLIRNYTKHAPGSVLVAFGDTKVIVTAMVEERVPRHVHQSPEPNAGWLTAEYAMLPGATNTRGSRERLKVSGRTNEIQRLIGRSLRAAFDLNRFGPRTIHVDADVIQADGGTRVAAITGAYVAVMDALKKLKADGLIPEIPVLSPVAAVSVGICEGTPLLDLNYDEDSTADVDANVIMNGRGELIELQMTSERVPFDRDALNALLDLAESGLKELIQIQEAALASEDQAAPEPVIAT